VIRLKPVVRGTNDAESKSETIELNGVVNGVECTNEVERRRVASPCCMVDRIKEVNERAVSVE